MTEFIVLYYAPQSAMEKMKNSSPEDMKKGMEGWMKWAEKCGEHLVDMGAPLGNGKHIDASNTATSNTATSSKTEVSGYSILKADNMAKVEELLKGHPHLGWADGCYIDVHEKMPLPC